MESVTRRPPVHVREAIRTTRELIADHLYMVDRRTERNDWPGVVLASEGAARRLYDLAGLARLAALEPAARVVFHEDRWELAQ